MLLMRIIEQIVSCWMHQLFLLTCIDYICGHSLTIFADIYELFWLIFIDCGRSVIIFVDIHLLFLLVYISCFC